MDGNGLQQMRKQTIGKKTKCVHIKGERCVKPWVTPSASYSKLKVVRTCALRNDDSDDEN